MSTDCRAYVEDPEDIYSKPLKCGYNPYAGEWSEWSTNPLKEIAIEFYGMEELVVDQQREHRAGRVLVSVYIRESVRMSQIGLESFEDQHRSCTSIARKRQQPQPTLGARL